MVGIGHNNETTLPYQPCLFHKHIETLKLKILTSMSDPEGTNF